MSGKLITTEALTQAIDAVVPNVLADIRQFYPPASIATPELIEWGITQEAINEEHLKAEDKHWNRELSMLANGFGPHIDNIKAVLLECLNPENRTGTPLSTGILRYRLANALIDELQIRGEVSQQICRAKGLIR